VGVFGGVLFVLALLVSIILHEFGHYFFARRAGGKVSEFFVGFGPRIWSTRRGETEYGVKAVPAGGYVKIIGMTDLEPVDPEDEPRAFYRKPLRWRLATLSAGSGMHFLIALVLLMMIPLAFGIDRQAKGTAVGQTGCLSADMNNPCNPKTAPLGPAAAAGIQAGDAITKVGATAVTDWTGLTDALRGLPANQPVTITVVRNGQTIPLTVTPRTAQKPDDNGKAENYTAIGISPVFQNVHKGPLNAVGYGFTQWGTIFKGSIQGLADIPKSIPKLFDSTVSNAPRTADTPTGVVGMTSLSGDIIQRDGWAAFLGFVASINLFIGIFNLLPLLPLDGGHIAIALYERARSTVARWRRRPDPGRVDLNKLMPVAFTFLVVFVGLSLLLLAADITNPIKLPG
jgi:membrane-associated protease RseP (regulator of RpoE activity)